MDKIILNGGLEFKADGDCTEISKIFGLSSGKRGHILSGAEGMYKLRDRKGTYDGEGMKLKSCEKTDNSAVFNYESEETALRMEYSIDKECDAAVLKMSASNLYQEDSVLYGVRARFVLDGGDFEVFSQFSGWCAENSGEWQKIVSGITIKNHETRSCSGGVPMAAVRDSVSGKGIAFHILPKGMWRIDITKVRYSGTGIQTVIDIGQESDGLELTLRPGETVTLPTIVFYSFGWADRDLASYKIQSYFIKRMRKYKTPPIVYNSWFYNFDKLDLTRFMEQAKIASELGCEVFCVDAGWFGKDGGWGGSTGDWVERQNGAFYGRMNELGDYVRSLGMRFGLWIEIERASKGSEIYSLHPEWFMGGSGGNKILNLANPEAWQYIFDTTCGLIEKYKLGFIKFDNNYGMSSDISNGGFIKFYEAGRRYMRALKEKYPEVFYEACSSGAERMDIETTASHDDHFVSDTADPLEVLRISQGALLRLPISAIGKWTVICGADIKESGESFPYIHTQIMVSGDAVWGKLRAYHPEFLMALAAGSPVGICGDLSGLPESARRCIKEAVVRLKEERDFFGRCVTYQLSGIASETLDIGSPAVLQHKSLDEDRSVVAAYRLGGNRRSYNIALKGLKADKNYSVKDFWTGEKLYEASGAELMDTMEITIEDYYSAKLFIVEA